MIYDTMEHWYSVPGTVLHILWSSIIIIKNIQLSFTGRSKNHSYTGRCALSSVPFSLDRQAIAVCHYDVVRIAQFRDLPVLVHFYRTTVHRKSVDE